MGIKKGNPLLMKVQTLIYPGFALMGVFSLARAAGVDSPLDSVPNVDLNRYVGRWYEIAKYPNRFERKCASDVKATYAIRADGKISVVNSCITHEGKLTQSRGWAKVVDRKTCSKLKVTFFWPFFGDYWIIDLGPNYEYAVIGEPSRKYLWVLSRTPKMDDTLYAELTNRLAAKGYDAARLERTKQTY
ncbi:lipocalin family protein [Edaphobacter paludis]|uniref:Lipocalin family protein n=1 Tax=Edaphobacter paludis TaxID=3035702 RepID=A0AAU7DC02_9BACT